MKAMRFVTATVALALASAAGLARADEAVDISRMTEQAAKSLVLVEYSYRSEATTFPESGQGIVLNKDGVILVSGALIPEALPRDYIRDIKVRLPLKQYTTVPATFLGRTTNRLFAYLKTDKPIDTPPLDLGKTAEPKTGQEVFAVGLLGRSGGYEPYTGVARVKAVEHLTHDYAWTGAFGLTRSNSPVFDLQTGALVGLTYPALSEWVMLKLDGVSKMVEMRADDQSGTFLPLSEIQAAITDVPAKAFESPRPWIGVDGLTGVDEDMRADASISQPGAVAVGSVIAGEPAEAGGLQARDIILTINGKEFTTSPVPELMVSHYQRALEKIKVGEEVKLGILRDRKTRMDITVKVGAVPKLASEVPQVFNGKLGITTRDLVFGEKYSRKLPADTKGVMVALVKQGAPATIGATPLRAGLLITKINDQNVEDEKQFGDLLAKALEDKDKTEIVFSVIQPNGDRMVCRVDLSK